jgi:hypothetical protein
MRCASAFRTKRWPYSWSSKVVENQYFTGVYGRYIMIYLHLLYCMAYKPRRSKKHHWEGENASAFYREKPQVLKKERGKVEKAMDVAIHDADRGSSVPAL